MPFHLGLYDKAAPESFSFEEKITLAKKCGYDYLEISIDETEEKLSRLYNKRLSDEIVSAVCKTELPVRTMCLSGHRKFPLGGIDERSLEIMDGALQLADKLGIRMIQLAGYDVYYEPSTPETRERFVKNLEKCVKMAATAGVIMGFETMETDFMNTVEKSVKYINHIRSPYLQIYPDIGNITNGAQDAVADLKKGDGHIIAAHLKETVPGRFRDMEYGQGNVDFDGCVAELMRQKVGMYTCEFWYDGHTEPLEYVGRNKAYVEKIFARYR